MRVGPLATIAATLVALGAAAGGAAAQERAVELKFSHWLPATHPVVKASEQWAQSIREASGGTISITLYPAQQLGKAFDHFDMARDGIADFAYANPGYTPGRFPVAGAAELPFVLANAKDGTAALDAWYRGYAPKEMADVHFCLAFVHDPGTFHATKKKIVLPTDIAGMKVRPASATIARLVTILGGTNVQASAVEAREILEKGVADAMTFPWGSIQLFGIDRVVKYHIDMPLYTGVQTWVMNKARYEAMSPAQRQVIDDHCNTDWATRVSSDWAEFEHSGRERLKAMPGHEVYALTPDELAQWRKAAEPLTQEWSGPVLKAGYDPKVVLDALKANAAKLNAAF